LAGLALTTVLPAPVDSAVFLAGLRLAGFAGASIDPKASVTADIAVRRSFLVAFIRALLNGSNIWPHI